MLRRILAHPLARGLDLDAPETTVLRRRIIRDKPFLRRIYEEWYALIASALPEPPGRVLEVGSGAGFLRELIPDLISSDLLPIDGVDLVARADALPVADGALRGVVMTNVLHHVTDVAAFFSEAGRAVRAGGRIVMIEPWVTSWSRFVYGRLHYEPFEPDATAWTFPDSGPLSGANGALPQIVFERDREKFELAFPQWRLDEVRLLMPLRYLLSGGVTMRSLSPQWTFAMWRGLEQLLLRWPRTWAMFALIVLTRVDPCDAP